MSLLLLLKPVKDFDVGGWLPEADFQRYIDRWKPEGKVSVEEQLRSLKETEGEIKVKVDTLQAKEKKDLTELSKLDLLEKELLGLQAYVEMLEDEMLFVFLMEDC